MTDSTSDRKFEHIRIIEQDGETDRRRGYFDAIHLTHRALPEISLQDVDPSCSFLGKTLSFPLLISSMTGGEHEKIRTVNRTLAQAAEAAGVAMGAGSQRVMFTHPEARDSFALRTYAPSTVLLSNLGAAQLNLGFGVEECRAAVDILEADGLYFHLNPLQEAVQPEGDTDFSGLADRMGDMARGLDVPVLAKEVGAGISPADARILMDQDITHLDVAGSGGTSWSRIEHHRNHGQSNPGLRFQDWGIPTPRAISDLHQLSPRPFIIASGGIRNGLDMLKAVILGARVCGLASPFLKAAMDSPEAVTAVIDELKREFMTGMFLLGIQSMDDLCGSTHLILEDGGSVQGA